LINIESQDDSIRSGTIPLLNPKENLQATVTIRNAQNDSKLSNTLICASRTHL